MTNIYKIVRHITVFFNYFEITYFTIALKKKLYYKYGTNLKLRRIYVFK